MSTVKVNKYEQLLAKATDIINGNLSLNEKLLAICTLLEEAVDTFDWVGFYLADPEATDELVLGPYVGPATDHTRIPYGKGICGQVALSHQTFISQDVKSEDNYLSCSADVQSEIVAPIMKNKEFVGQLDIDSNTKHSITDEQRALVENICRLLTNEF